MVRLLLFGFVLGLLLVSDLSFVDKSLLVFFSVNVRLFPLGGLFSVWVSLIIVAFVAVVVIVTSLGSELLITRPFFVIASLLVVRLLALMAAADLISELLVRIVIHFDVVLAIRAFRLLLLGAEV